MGAVTHREQASFLAAWLDDPATAGPYGVTADVLDLTDSIEKALQLWENKQTNCPCQRSCGAKHETKRKVKGTGK